MTFLKQAALALVFGAVCFSAGRFLSPAKVETKEVEKIVYRERTDTTKSVDKRETTLPDGTRIVETRTDTKRIKDKSADIETSKETVTTNRPDWHISASMYQSLLLTGQYSYSLSVERRLFSEVYFGVYATSEKQVGLSVGIGF